MEGFDLCADRTELAANRALTFTDAAATGIQYSTTGGRRSGGALYINATNSPDTALRTCMVAGSPNGGTSFNNCSDLVLGVAFKIKRGTFNVTTGTNSIFLFEGHAGASEVFNVRLFTSANEWRLGYYTGATLRYTIRFPGASGDEYFPAEDTWYYLELKVTDFVTSAAGNVTFRVNGTALGTSGAVITASTGTLVNRISLNKGVSASSLMTSGQEVWWDDLWWGVLTGGYPIDFLGDVRVECVRPAGAGTHDGWSKSAGTVGLDLVDEATEDGDTTYIFSDTAAAKFTCKIGSWPNNTVPGDTIHAVQPSAVVRNEGASTKKILATYVSTEAGSVNDNSLLTDFCYVPGATYAMWFGALYSYEAYLTEPNRQYDAISIAEITEDFEFGVTLV